MGRKPGTGGPTHGICEDCFEDCFREQILSVELSALTDNHDERGAARGDDDILRPKVVSLL